MIARLRCNLYFAWLFLKYAPAIVGLLPKLSYEEAQRDLETYTRLYDSV
jgi:hypothetical protein